VSNENFDPLTTDSQVQIVNDAIALLKFLADTLAPNDLDRRSRILQIQTMLRDDLLPLIAVDDSNKEVA